MKMIAAAVALGLLLLPFAAGAQDNKAALPPAPAAPPPAPAPSAKQVLEDCRAAVLAKKLGESAQRKAIAACVIEASPKIARRIHCLMDPRLRTMDKDARVAAIASCIQSGQ